MQHQRALVGFPLLSLLRQYHSSHLGIAPGARLEEPDSVLVRSASNPEFWRRAVPPRSIGKMKGEPILEGALANLIIAAGAAAQAAIGMGLNLFAIPLLALIDPVYVPGPVLVHGFLLSCLASLRLRSIDLRELGPALIGLVAGTAAAAVLLVWVTSDQLPRLLGVFVLVAVALSAVGYQIKPTTRSVLAASSASGVMGIVAGAHGPPIALLYQNESPSRIRSVLLPFFAFSNPIALGALSIIGKFGWREVYVSALLLPGLAVGFLASSWLSRLVSARIIRACLLAISAVSGVALILRN